MTAKDRTLFFLLYSFRLLSSRAHTGLGIMWTFRRTQLLSQNYRASVWVCVGVRGGEALTVNLVALVTLYPASSKAEEACNTHTHHTHTHTHTHLAHRVSAGDCTDLSSLSILVDAAVCARVKVVLSLWNEGTLLGYTHRRRQVLRAQKSEAGEKVRKRVTACPLLTSTAGVVTFIPIASSCTAHTNKSYSFPFLRSFPVLDQCAPMLSLLRRV